MHRAIDWRLRVPYGSFRGCAIFKLSEDLSASSNLMPKSAREFSMDLLIREMDAAGVRVGVVPIRKENDNDDIGRLIRDYPGRFAGMAHIDPFEGEKALADIEKYVVNGPASGIMLEPGQIFLQDSLTPNDPLLYPIYEYCQEKGVVVTQAFGGLFGRALKYYNPADMDEVARAFPNLKIVLTHGGFPYNTETCWIAYHRPNVFLSPDFWMFSMNPGHEHYVTACNNFLQDQMIFGTCYPAVSLDWAIDDLIRSGVKESVLDKLLYANAARLLGLED